MSGRILAACALTIGLSWGASAQPIESKVTKLTQDYNAFGQDLFRKLAADPGNIVFSPYSIGTAMAMAASGARGETQAEMLRVLKHRLAPSDIDEANALAYDIFRGYDKSRTSPSCPAGMELKGDRCEADASKPCPLPDAKPGECFAKPVKQPSAQLLTANALMMTRLGQGIILESYIANIKAKYQGEVFKNATLGDINGWVARKTEGKIPSIMDQPDPNMIAVLLNAVYFKAPWASSFDKRLTRNSPFHVTASQEVMVPMMHQRGRYSLAEGQGYRAIRLPYQVNSLAMIVVLPEESEPGPAVTRLDGQEFSRLLTALHGKAELVDLALPRFKIAYKSSLGNALQEAGMKLAFKDTADFSGMTSSPEVYIGRVLHKAVIEVDEEGTEAAAATAVTFKARSAIREHVASFIVDRPFLFYLVDDRTGAVLFQGRVSDPNLSA